MNNIRNKMTARMNSIKLKVIAYCYIVVVGQSRMYTCFVYMMMISSTVQCINVQMIGLSSLDSSS